MNRIKSIAILNIILVIAGIIIVLIKPFANSLWWGVGIMSVCSVTALALYVINFNSIRTNRIKK